MKTNNIWAWVIIVLVVIGAVLYFYPSSNKTTENPTNLVGGNTSENAGQPAAAQGGTTYEVLITSKSFSPLRLNINVGDKVTFKNADNRTHWPASVPKPLVGSYPGYDPAKCGTADESTILDSCKDLNAGESYTFTFNEKGTWAFWDKDIPSWTGQVKVN